MVRHCGEIEGTILGIDAVREPVWPHPYDRPTLGEPVGVARQRMDEANARVEREPRVQVGLAEEGLTQRLVAGARLPGLGPLERGSDCGGCALLRRLLRRFG